MKSEGTVVALDSQGQALVALDPRPASCGGCQSREACSSSLLAPGDERQIRLVNRIGARVGERVTVVVAAGTVLKASWLSYLVPGLLALAGAIVGQAMGGDEAAVGGTIAGLMTGFVYLSWRSRAAGLDQNLVWLERETGTICRSGTASAISEKS